MQIAILKGVKVSTDLSFKDNWYFIDRKRFNCPYCNRKNIAYTVRDKFEVDWTASKKVYGYVVRCSDGDCGKSSLHLSNYSISYSYNGFAYPVEVHYSHVEGGEEWYGKQQNKAIENVEFNHQDGQPYKLDELFFYHQPSSFFTIDKRINREIRNAISEAENCKKNGFLTGGSACLRKSIYVLLKKEDIPIEKDGSYYSYEERIDLLREKYPGVEQGLFSVLKIVQSLTSVEVHENSWNDFGGGDLNMLIRATKELLEEMYVIPDDKRKRIGPVMKMYEQYKESKKDG